MFYNTIMYYTNATAFKAEVLDSNIRSYRFHDVHQVIDLMNPEVKNYLSVVLASYLIWVTKRQNNIDRHTSRFNKLTYVVD